VLAIEKVFNSPDFKKEMEQVYKKASSYNAAFEHKRKRETEEIEILNWIHPEAKGYIPERSRIIGDTCQWFFSSEYYLNWVSGQGDSALICSGKRMGLISIKY